MITQLSRHIRFGLFICALFGLASCAAPGPKQHRAPFEQALNETVDDLFNQTRKLPAFLTNVESKIKKLADQQTIVVDPLLDGTTGQQTEITKKAELQLMQRVQSRFDQFTVLPFTSNDVAKAQYLVNGTISQLGNPGSNSGYRLNLAMTDLKTGMVIAQAAARITDSTLDTSPTSFYRDSPAIAKDRVVEGYIKTSETKAGMAADQVYLERLPTSALLSDAIALYNKERYTEALAAYEAAAKRPDGQQLRVYNGIYLANWQLQRHAEAEKAFGVIARLGLATNNLSVKFLFKPGSTDFIPDAKLTGPYPMWLRQIARQTMQADQCVNVIGHTSRTGGEQTNERLSLQRALVIKSRLLQEEVGLSRKLFEEGRGFKENIVGSGTDDARDALDRRVEFRVVKCDA